MKESLDIELETIDRNIRSGKNKIAVDSLVKLSKKKISRPHVAKFAALAMRAYVPQLGLKILFPIVHPEKKLLQPPTDTELVEYAACLVRMGAEEEALKLLEKIDSSVHPIALLLRAFSLMAQWNYKDAIPFLSTYIETNGLPPYQRLVGMVNLSAALVYEREHKRAVLTLNELIQDTRKGEFFLLLGNSLELSATNQILQGNFTEAETIILQSKKLLKDTHSLDEFFVRKWEAILNFLKNVESKKEVDSFHAIREEAKKRSHWETIRDFDRYEAIARKDEALLLHLYFGTPYEIFRTRLLKDFGGKVVLPEQYSWNIAERMPFCSKKIKEVRLLVDGSDCNGQMKQGLLVHKLFLVLASDFYRPIRIAPLYYRLYPDEYFNPITAPARIHVAVGRLRELFKVNNIPLKVEENMGAYKLLPVNPCLLVVPREMTLRAPNDATLERIRSIWKTDFFTAKEAGNKLNVTSRTVLRLLTKAIEQNEIERVGKRAAVKYRFKT